VVILHKKQNKPHGATAPFKNPPQIESVKKRLPQGSNSSKAEISHKQTTHLTDLELNEILKAVLGCTELKK
jgi:hypothetical protein